MRYSMKSSVAEQILSVLSGRGVGHVFLVPGAQIDPFFAALSKSESLRPVIANHELGAGYMADGYARAGGTPGVALSIGAPGAANLLGAAVTARADGSPVLFITGNIPAAMQGQGEFQDGGPQGSNDAALYQSATAASFACSLPEGWQGPLANAERVLASGMPAHLGVPLDVQQAQAEPVTEAVAFARRPDSGLPDDLLARGRPLLVVGGAALNDRLDSVLLQRVAAEFRVPLVTDWAARGVVPETRREVLGHVGFMPHPRALAALGADSTLSADRLVTVGFARARLGRFLPGHLAVIETTAAAFAAWALTHAARPDAETLRKRDAWLSMLAGIARPPVEACAEQDTIPLAALVDCANSCLAPTTLIAIDAGQIRRVAASRLVCNVPHSLLMAENMSPMGWGLCAAIGAKLACPDRPVVALVGDGAMRMHGVELATAVRYRLPVLFVVCDNRGYGSIVARMTDEKQAALARLPAVDWCGFARVLGMPAQRVGHIDELRDAFAQVQRLDGPMLLSVPVPLVDGDAYQEASGIGWVPTMHAS